jgi:hypothetical protein
MITANLFQQHGEAERYEMQGTINKSVEKSPKSSYTQLLNRISQRYTKGKSIAFQAVNECIIDTNWDIGKYIVEFEQKGSSRAKYGVNLLDNLSKDLTLRYGRGFSRSSLNYIRLFTCFFQIVRRCLTICLGPITAS